MSYSKKGLRQKLRNNMTTQEEELWRYLRNSNLGYKFRRQHSIGRYIVDFYCPKKKLVVEIDGSQHYTENALEYDKLREEFMKSLGIKTIRFSNIEVNRDIEVVVEEIVRSLK